MMKTAKMVKSVTAKIGYIFGYIFGYTPKPLYNNILYYFVTM